MAAAVFYRQVWLARGEDAHTDWHIAWIPESLARVGQQVELREDGSNWLVAWASTMRVNGEYLLEHERDYAHQREASDV